MFTVFSFKELDDKFKLRDVLYHMGPQIEDLINIVLYSFPEKYKDIVRSHLPDPDFHRAINDIILATYKEFKNTKEVWNKWSIYHRAFNKIKKFFIDLIRKGLNA
jgi:hypothetical protein